MNREGERGDGSHFSPISSMEKIFTSSRDRKLAHAVEAGLTQVENGLHDEIRFTDPVANASARYLLEAGGKRVRPMLALVIAQLGNGNTDDVITAAEAIEITHLASLYHDDVMDNAEKRRGVPSAQTIWGNSVAILTGDLLFARASQLMATLGERAIRMQANTFERLVLGQMRETLGPSSTDNPIDHYLRVLSDKTGSLIAVAARAGIVFSQAPPEYEMAVTQFGEKIGVAFQLIDDVIDLSPSEKTGKIPGTDLRRGVPTLPLLRLREMARADKASADLTQRIEETVIGTYGEDTDPTDSSHSRVTDIITELRNHPATEATVTEAHTWARHALEALEPLPKGNVKKALTRFAETIVERTH